MNTAQQEAGKVKSMNIKIYRPFEIIEGWYMQNSTSHCALLLPPNPALGGTIANAVLKAVNDAFISLGFSTLRIRYRSSSNENREHDQQDAGEALDWLVSKGAEYICVGGYGYGATVAVHTALRKPDSNAFIAISPNITTEFNSLTPCPSGLVLTAEHENTFEHVKSIFSSLLLKKGASIEYSNVAGANHLYTGYLPEIYAKVCAYLKDSLKQSEAPGQKVA